MTHSQTILITLATSALCLVGDYLLKQASRAPFPFRTAEFAIAVVIFGASAIGWVLILPHLKLAAVGVIYGVSTVLFMALLGWLVFGETLTVREWAGLVFGVASILLLARFG